MFFSFKNIIKNTDFCVRVAKGIIKNYDKLDKEKTIAMDFACGNGKNLPTSLRMKDRVLTVH